VTVGRRRISPRRGLKRVGLDNFGKRLYITALARQMDCFAKHFVRKEIIMTKRKSGTFKVAQIVTDRIVTALKEGTIPWRKAWNTKLAQNFITGKAYRGVNQLILNLTDNSTPYFVSQRQAVELEVQGLRKEGKEIAEKVTKSGYKTYWNTTDDCMVKPIENYGNYNIVCYFKLLEVEKDGEIKSKVPMLRYYKVWNIDDCKFCETTDDSIRVKLAHLLEEIEMTDEIEVAETIFKNYLNTEGVKTKVGNSAYYNISKDIIVLPEVGNFEYYDEYYSTAFHEAVHSTGHKTRLDRFKTEDKIEEYSKEELVAEIGSAILCGHSDIENDGIIENTNAYCKNWIKILEDNPRMIIKASSVAQKAVDKILGIEWEETKTKKMAKKVKKTDKMADYEIETSKNAIWNGKITKGFLTWKEEKLQEEQITKDFDELLEDSMDIITDLPF